jgi:predicted HicB family RNase H-like nuclease
MDINKYQYQVFYSEEDQAFVSTVAEFPYLSADGASAGEAIAELRSVVEEAVGILLAEGKGAPLPLCEREYKGNISLRLSAETHKLAVTRAREEGCSLNQFLTSLIEKNIYADKIESIVNALGRVASELEVNQLVRELSARTVPVGGERQGRSSYLGTSGGQLGVMAEATNIPLYNTAAPGLGGV